ncbi:YoaK family protein [Micromonospora sp. WMMD964]|uniref:YoaK family protein n=1 Tax=Micromonospora sp. WMMD964 TaxID=3016091 RepID=UPI00249A0700|nr:YoaK family protein [Micromonospora sp. WMMD964]WFE99122.1 YoaK family protein [Micromonospora sp. WMMD964]
MNLSHPSAASGSAGREPLLPALMTATAVSGVIDAISYLGLGHVFTANMTGNVVILGFAAAGAPGFSVLGSLVSLAAFLLGAGVAGRLATIMGSGTPHRQLRWVLGVELVLLAAATAVAFATSHAIVALIALTALAMGLRNGTVRKLAVPDVTTTVLTLTLTGLASDSKPAGGSNPRAGRRVASVLAMLAGAFGGALLVRHVGVGWPLLAATVGTAVAVLAVPRSDTAS